MSFLKKYWLPTLMAGVGGYFLYRQFSKPKSVVTGLPPAESSGGTFGGTTSGGTTISTSVPTGFPLKKGSKGAMVVKLQKAMLAIDPKILPKYGADGDFGTETETALKTLTGRTIINSPSEIDGLTSGTRPTSILGLFGIK